MSLRIGLFDSGVGGLSVLKELYAHVRAEYVYVGDSLRAPYGNKTKDELTSCTRDLLSFLQQKDVDIFISACNSLSTLETDALLESLSIERSRYIDMRAFAAAAKPALPENASVLVYGTTATLATHVYQDIYAAWNPQVLASSHLAYAIETGHQIEIDEEIDSLVDYIIGHNISHVILACTHYPLIQEYIDKRCVGLVVTFINIAHYVPGVLTAQQGDRLSLEVFTTKNSEVFETYVNGIDDVLPKVIEL